VRVFSHEPSLFVFVLSMFFNFNLVTCQQLTYKGPDVGGFWQWFGIFGGAGLRFGNS